MRTFKALYIDTSGTVKYNLFPEEPKAYDFDYDFCDPEDLIDGVGYKLALDEYRKALAVAKESSIEVSDQEQAREVIIEDYLKRGDAPPFKYRGSLVIGLGEGIYRLPSGWRVEVVSQSCIYRGVYPFTRPVAVLKPIQKESVGYSIDTNIYTGEQAIAYQSNIEDHLPDSGEMVESQEELWEDVLLITDDPRRNYSRDDATIKQLYNRFTITRKP